MLILQRKIGESLMIGDNIKVTVVAVESGGRVRLAIEAPRDIPILREATAANRDSAKLESTPTELIGLLEQWKNPAKD